MNFLKRWGSLMITFAIVIAIVPWLVFTSDAASVSGSAYSKNAEIANKIDQVFKAYPPGKSYFTKNGKICATCHSNTKIDCVDSPSNCNCLGRSVTVNGKNVDLLATQCYGYARYWQLVLFGTHERKDTSKFKQLSGITGSLTESRVKTWFTNNKALLHPGTHIRVNNNGHSIILLSADYTNGKITYAQCNWGGGCVVNPIEQMSWNEFASEFNSLTFAMVYKNYYSQYPDGNALTISYNVNGGTIDEPEAVGVTYKVTTGDGLNVRSGPGTSYSKLGAFTINTSFVVIETVKKSDYTWGRIEYKGKEGWVALGTSFVTKTGTQWSSQYCVRSSMVYTANDDSLLSPKWAYGQVQADGLHNDTTLGLYRNGYTFKGWSTAPTGATVFDMNQSLRAEEILPDLVNGSKSVTLYAIWEADIPPVVDETVESVTVASVPPRSVYYVGESAMADGLTLLVRYKDGSCNTVATGFVCTPSVFTAEGEQSVTVDYSGKTASYTVNVTQSKTRIKNGVSMKASVAYFLPSTDAATIVRGGKSLGSFVNDEMQILCRDGDFYLAFMPWANQGESTITAANGTLFYFLASDISLTGTVPAAEEYYSMNPTGEKNAAVNADAKLYYKPDGGKNPIKHSGVEIPPNSVSAGTRIKVLFEIDGYYCVQTDTYMGFVEKTLVTLDPILCGLESSVSSLNVPKDGVVDTSAIKIYGVMSDGTKSDELSCEFSSISTDTEGVTHMIVSYRGLTTPIRVNVVEEIATLVVESMPYKKAYPVGAKLDVTGMKVSLTYESGATKDVTEEVFIQCDFNEVGYHAVEIRYEEMTEYMTVLVYESPEVGILYASGYQNQTVTLPVMYHSLCDYVTPTAFEMEISYDSEQLSYEGHRDGELSDPAYLIVNDSVEGKLKLAYAGRASIEPNIILTSLDFNIKGSDGVETSQTLVRIDQITLLDSLGNQFEVRLTEGEILNEGKIPISFISEGEVWDTSSANYGDFLRIGAIIPQREGYVFKGWSTSQDAEKAEFDVLDEIECTGPMCFYAVWSAISEYVPTDSTTEQDSEASELEEETQSESIDEPTQESSGEIGTVQEDETLEDPDQTIDESVDTSEAPSEEVSDREDSPSSETSEESVAETSSDENSEDENGAQNSDPILMGVAIGVAFGTVTLVGIGAIFFFKKRKI